MTEQDQLFAATISPYSPGARKLLLILRKLVLSTARNLNGVGEITEALRWGQFSFLTLESASGSTIRIDGKRKDANAVAMYFHCQSGLVDHFRELYGDSLKFEGKRAIVLDVRAYVPEAAIRHCISLALTHHLRKIPEKSGRRKIATPHHHRHRPRPG
jgi:hypothetical protein